MDYEDFIYMWLKGLLILLVATVTLTPLGVSIWLSVALGNPLYLLIDLTYVAVGPLLPVAWRGAWEL